MADNSSQQPGGRPKPMARPFIGSRPAPAPTVSAKPAGPAVRPVSVHNAPARATPGKALAAVPNSTASDSAPAIPSASSAWDFPTETDQVQAPESFDSSASAPPPESETTDSWGAAKPSTWDDVAQQAWTSPDAGRTTDDLFGNTVELPWAPTNTEWSGTPDAANEEQTSDTDNPTDVSSSVEPSVDPSMDSGTANAEPVIDVEPTPSFRWTSGTWSATTPPTEVETDAGDVEAEQGMPREERNWSWSAAEQDAASPEWGAEDFDEAGVERETSSNCVSGAEGIDTAEDADPASMVNAEFVPAVDRIDDMVADDDAMARERMATLLERLALRIREGEIALGHGTNMSNDAAVLAWLLCTLLSEAL